MKLIIAFIKPQMLSDVILALHEVHLLPGISVTDVRGFGAAAPRTLRIA